MISEREINLLCAACGLIGLVLGAGGIALFAALRMVKRSRYEALVADYNDCGDKLNLVTAERDELKKEIGDRDTELKELEPLRVGNRPNLDRIKGAAESDARRRMQHGGRIAVRPINP